MGALPVSGAVADGAGALAPMRRRAVSRRKERDISGKPLRIGGLTMAKRAQFLAVLAETSSVSGAAAATGATASAFYQLRRRDPGFAAEWADAVRQGHAALETALLARARGTADADTGMDSALALAMLKRMDALADGRQPRQGHIARRVPLRVVCDELLRRIAIVTERLERGRS